MKYFLQLKIMTDGKKQAVHYFLPERVSRARKVEDKYVVTANLVNGEYSFNVSCDKHILGEWSNYIDPKQPVVIQDGDTELEFSLLSVFYGKRKVGKYLQSQPGVSVEDMEDFYCFVGKEPKSKKEKPRRSTGPLSPTSGMDPDLRAEYARGDDRREEDQDGFKPYFNLVIRGDSFDDVRFDEAGLNAVGDTHWRKKVNNSEDLLEFGCDCYIADKELNITIFATFKDDTRVNILSLKEVTIGYLLNDHHALENHGREIPLHIYFEYAAK